MRRPNKPRITKPRLVWKWDRFKENWQPYHRVSWTENGKRKQKAILLNWRGDAEKLDHLYWACEAGRHEKQAPPPPKYSWQELITAWRKDLRIQNKLAPSTRVQYHRVMDEITRKNGTKDVRHTSRQALRRAHKNWLPPPRKADRYIQTVKMLWNSGTHKLDWPLGPNPASGIDFFGKQREYEPWPDWMVNKLETAPENMHIAAELLLGTGQRPSGAITMRRDHFSSD